MNPKIDNETTILCSTKSQKSAISFTLHHKLEIARHTCLYAHLHGFHRHIHTHKWAIKMFLLIEMTLLVKLF
jgi:hypothetical protein